jgi:hypothetical protein
MKGNMILVDALSDAIRTSYQSIYVKSETPVSLLLVADTDLGKSKLIMHHMPQATRLNVEILTDVSASGLYKIVKDKTDPVCIVIPDFHSVVSHRAPVTEGTINALMTLLEDGAMKVSVGPGEPLELKGKRASLITAMTPGILKGKAGKWRRLGFLRRVLPVNYCYSDATVTAIHNSIKAGEYHRPIPKFSLPVTEPQFVGIPKPLDKEIQDLAVMVSVNLANRGFTAHKFFRVYTQARALLQKRNTVIKQDVEDLRNFSKFCNLEVPFQI